MTEAAVKPTIQAEFSVLLRLDELNHLIETPKIQAKLLEVPVLGRGVVAVSPERQLSPSRLGPNVNEPAPEVFEVLQLITKSQRIPGHKRVIGGDRGLAVADCVERTPEVDAILDVLHVDVDFDVRSGDGDAVDTPPAVHGARSE